MHENGGLRLGVGDFEVKRFLMKSENYFTVVLPRYFDFTPILREMDKKLGQERLGKQQLEKMRECEGVNYRLPVSKNAQEYAQREFRIIHPLVYVELVRILVENWGRVQARFSLFQRQKTVMCTSVAPGLMTQRSVAAASIMQWWNGIEQTSMKMAIYYNVMAKTDIQDCYASMDLRLLERAIGGGVGDKMAKVLAASERGNYRGLPQGSVLADLLAEAVLGYIDVAFDNEVRRQKLKGEFTVVRFRDDYRMFAKDEMMVRRLVKILAEVLLRFGMKLNATKTKISDEIIVGARKEDKACWDAMAGMVTGAQPDSGDVVARGGEIGFGVRELGLQKQLLLIYELARRYPNSGSVQKALFELYERKIYGLEHRTGDLYPLVGIVVEMLVRNPRVVQILVAILTKLMSFNPGISRKSLADRVMAKARMRPEADYTEVWVQRLTAKQKPGKKYESAICRLMYDQRARIWNSNWTEFRVLDYTVVNHAVIREMEFVMPVEEVKLFVDYREGGEYACDEGATSWESLLK